MSTHVSFLWRVIAAGSLGLLTASLYGGPARAMTKGPDPMDLLHRSALASRTVDYSGTQLVACYGEPESLTMVADVVHVPGQGSTLHIHATPRTPAREVFEPDAGSGPWLALGSELGAPFGSTTLALVESHFAAALTGEASVAGRRTEVVELTRASGLTAARFWLDAATALPLRREIYDDKGQLTEMSVFLDFDLRTARTDMAVASTAARVPTVTGVRLTTDQVDVAREDGWLLPVDLGAFQLVEIRRTETTETADAGKVMHLVYSDGLSTVSVFQQKGRLRVPTGWHAATMAKHRVWVKTGIPTAVAWSAAGRVFTVVSNTPSGQLAQVIGGLPAAHQHAGILTRLHRGADRVMSWLNPFA